MASRGRVGLQRLLHAALDREGVHLGHWHPGEVGQGHEDAVGPRHVLLDPPQVFGHLLGAGVAGVEQEVGGGLDHVEGVAQLVGDAAGHLADGRQPLAPLLPGQVFALVGVLDLGEVQVEQLVWHRGALRLQRPNLGAFYRRAPRPRITNRPTHVLRRAALHVP
jgi:hypothetical protein